MGLLEDCLRFFDVKDLYSVLGLARDASAEQISKNYRRLALKYHPDRHESGAKEESTRAFQTLGQVHLVLSDADKRAFYDSTGLVDGSSGLDGDTDWTDYFRALFPKVTKKGESCSTFPLPSSCCLRPGQVHGAVHQLRRRAG